jgi:hypothetical protein
MWTEHMGMLPINSVRDPPIEANMVYSGVTTNSCVGSYSYRSPASKF